MSGLSLSACRRIKHRVGTDSVMLYLTRKVGEAVVINDNIEITVVELRGKTAKLGITFPPEATVLRKELHDRIMDENLAAASGDSIPIGNRENQEK